MSALEVLRAKRSEIQSIAAKHGAGNRRVFGETHGEAHGEADGEADGETQGETHGETQGAGRQPAALFRNRSERVGKAHQRHYPAAQAGIVHLNQNVKRDQQSADRIHLEA